MNIDITNVAPWANIDKIQSLDPVASHEPKLKIKAVCRIDHYGYGLTEQHAQSQHQLLFRC